MSQFLVLYKIKINIYIFNRHSSFQKTFVFENIFLHNFKLDKIISGKMYVVFFIIIIF